MKPALESPAAVSVVEEEYGARDGSEFSTRIQWDNSSWKVDLTRCIKRWDHGSGESEPKCSYQKALENGRHRNA